VLAGAVVPRPPLPVIGPAPVAIGEYLEFSGIPPGTLVKYPGGELIVDDGFLEWAALEPGEYEFRFENFPYQEESFRATVA